MLGRIFNSILRPAGYQIKRLGANALTLETISEIEVLCRQTHFPTLRSCEGRASFLSQLIGTSLVEALYLLNELSQALSLDGDVCEFGIAQGATSALIGNEIRNTSKTLWLFDSFEGLPRPTEKDKLIDDIFNLGSIEKYKGKMAVPQQSVLSRLKSSRLQLDRIQIVPGFIEETSKRNSLPGRVCFAYVDFDFYEPILIALRLLASRLSIGGRVMVDDYGFFSEGAQAAVDEFVRDSGDDFDLRLPPAGCGHFAMMTRLR